MPQWLMTRLADWLITGAFGTLTLWRFSEGSELGFSWALITQIGSIVGIWLTVIAAIAVWQEVKRIRLEGESEESIVIFSFDPEQPKE